MQYVTKSAWGFLRNFEVRVKKLIQGIYWASKNIKIKSLVLKEQYYNTILAQYLSWLIAYFKQHRSSSTVLSRLFCEVSWHLRFYPHSFKARCSGKFW